MKIKRPFSPLATPHFILTISRPSKMAPVMTGLSTPAIRSRLDLPLFVRRVNVFPYN